MADETSTGSNKLSKNSIGLTGMIMITIAGVLAIIGPLESAAFIGDAGEAAVWPVILGFVLFALVSLPILEYTRIAPFAGGYYGLAELGFGKGAGKFTSLSNYFFYNFWQMANAFFIAFLAVDTVYYLYNIMLPFWSWILFGVITLILTYTVSVMRAKNLGRVIVAITIPTLVLVVAFIIYVIVKSPYNSPAFLNPGNSSTGISGIFLATAVLGFYLYAGYGASIFFGEEGVKARKNLWRAVYIGLSISAVVIALSVYSELIAIPRSDLSVVSGAANPQLVTWTHYFPIGVLMAFNKDQFSRAAFDMYKLYGLLPIADGVRSGTWKYHYNLEAKKKWYGPYGGFDSEIGWSLWIKYLKENENIMKDFLTDDQLLLKKIPNKMGPDPIIPLIEALTTGGKIRCYLNVRNDGNIPQLPSECAVEVPVIADRQGIHPEKVNGLKERVVKEVLIPRTTNMELALDAYFSGSKDMLLEILFRDVRTRNEKQANEVLEHILNAPGNIGARKHYR